MHLILVDNCLRKLLSLRDNYENRTKINLEALPQPYNVSLFFGKKDVKNRLKQIKFIENWLDIFRDKLKPDLNFACELEIQEHLMGLRMLVAVIFYTRNQIDETYTVRSGSSSTLALLLEEALSLGHGNTVDEETYACCLLTAQRFTQANELHYINSLLAKQTKVAKQAYISDIEWNRFTRFIMKECSNLDKKWRKNYPITSVTIPLFALPLEAAGTSIGWLIGDLAAQSYSLLSTRHALTAMFGSGLILLMGSGVSTGVMLLSPTYAGKLLDTFFGVSFAYVLGLVMRLLGTGLGWGVGMTLDVGWKLLYSACSLITTVLLGNAKHPPITGFVLVNGHRVIDGIELDVINLLEANNMQSEHYETRPIIFNLVDDGVIIRIGHEEAKITWQPSEKEPIHLQKLLTQLKENQSMTVEEIHEEKQEEKMLLP